jgi:hypothetical protein
MKTIEIVTPEMRADCLAAHDAIIDLAAERDLALAEVDRLKLALGAALVTLEKHGEDRLCVLIRTTAGDCRECALAMCGPVLVVDNGSEP